MSVKARSFIIDIVYDIVGSLFLAIGIYCFIEKADIAPGGISGIAVMIKYLWDLPIGIMILVINIPIMIMAFRYLGREFSVKTLRTLLISSFILDYTITPYLPQYAGDRMLGSIFGGICMGVGLGVIFARGSTTAGTDVLSVFVEKRYPHIRIGTALLIVDCVILGASMIVFGNIEAGLFGLIALFCQTKVIDTLVYGMDKGRQVTIMSKHNEHIAARIIKELEHTATYIKSQGAYGKDDCLMLLCVVRMQEYHKLKQIVREEDPDAFIIVVETNQIIGEGFKSIMEQR